MPRLSLAPVFAALLACAPASGDCPEKVAAMRALFAQAETDPIVINPPDGAELPQSSRGVAIEDGLPVFILADGALEMGGARHPTVAALKDTLTEELDKAAMLAERQDRPLGLRLVLVADARAPVAPILELVESVPPETKFMQIVTLAGDTIPTPPPIPPAVREVQDIRDADQRAPRLLELFNRASGSCTAIREAFVSARTDPENYGKAILDGISGAVEKCGCQGVDVETLVATVWLTFGKTAPSLRGLVLPLSRDPAAEAVTLPPGATATELARLAETRAATPFRVTLSP